MKEELSEKLDRLRFPLIASVVFVHSQLGAVRFSDGTASTDTGYLSTLVQATFSEILRGAAVPLFFLLSGFLFFQTFEPTCVSYIHKIKTRFRSLILPFLFWNAAVLLFLSIAGRLPALSPFFTGGSWALPQGGLFELLNALVGINRRPILYPFWFLRDLIVLVLLSPVIWYFASRLPLIGILLCLIGWVYQTRTPYPVVHHHAPLFFFYLGGLMAVRKTDPLRVLPFRGVLLLLFAVLVLASAMLKVIEVSPVVGLWFEKVSAFVVILTFWSVVALLDERHGRILGFLSGLSFFVYAAHEPTLIVFTKLFFRFYPPSGDAQRLVYYFLIPSLTIIFTGVIGLFLRTRLKAFYGLIAGGRASS